MVKYGDISLPISYEIVHKDVSFCDVATHKLRRKASVSKNEHFCKMITQAVQNNIKFQYVLADSWFASTENFKHIYALKKDFIIALKSNRTVALSAEDKKNSRFLAVSNLDMEDGKALKVWLKDLQFPVALIKKIFINEDNSVGELYLVSSDLSANGDDLYETYKKRWDIEVFHKSIKQNTSLAKSPTKRLKTQANHIFASMIAFCKLEMLKLKTAANHFAIKCKLTIAANIAAMNELKKLYKSECAA
jgi:IS4 transposase